MDVPSFPDLQDSFYTERLSIRCPRPGDAGAVYEAIVETLTDLRAWSMSLPWARSEPSIDASERFCREGAAAYLSRKDFPMLIFSRKDAGFVGASGIHRPDWSAGKCEIGFWCRRRYQGFGLMTEAVLAITNFAVSKLGMHRIEIRCDAQNVKTRRLCERAGFSLESVAPAVVNAQHAVHRQICTFVHHAA